MNHSYKPMFHKNRGDIQIGCSQKTLLNVLDMSLDTPLNVLETTDRVGFFNDKTQ
ncbi:unnamed protein product [Meloidogyne enterolobii]|uniref:Uncharacterized protein n=1 Tax=Meloidogyne enterolobii TaxID=390850 RepID=A0ACB1A965_MELEN